VIPNMFRKAMVSKSSGFVGVTLNFGSIDQVSSTEFPPHWANTLGGSALKAEATNVSLSALGAGATITITVLAESGSAPPIKYAKNDGAITNYTGGFTVLGSEYLKIAASPPSGIDGYGTIIVNADGVTVSSIPYYWSSEN